jgi:hypothetical protein
MVNRERFNPGSVVISTSPSELCEQLLPLDAHVRYSPHRDRTADIAARPLCANSGSELVPHRLRDSSYLFHEFLYNRLHRSARQSHHCHAPRLRWQVYW